MAHLEFRMQPVPPWDDEIPVDDDSSSDIEAAHDAETTAAAEDAAPPLSKNRNLHLNPGKVYPAYTTIMRPLRKGHPKWEAACTRQCVVCMEGPFTGDPVIFSTCDARCASFMHRGCFDLQLARHQTGDALVCSNCATPYLDMEHVETYGYFFTTDYLDTLRRPELPETSLPGGGWLAVLSEFKRLHAFEQAAEYQFLTAAIGWFHHLFVESPFEDPVYDAASARDVRHGEGFRQDPFLDRGTAGEAGEGAAGEAGVTSGAVVEGAAARGGEDAEGETFAFGAAGPAAAGPAAATTGSSGKDAASGGGFSTGTGAAGETFTFGAAGPAAATTGSGGKDAGKDEGGDAGHGSVSASGLIY
eukprot:g5123.t1